jgi:hypothetical protein
MYCKQHAANLTLLYCLEFKTNILFFGETGRYFIVCLCQIWQEKMKIWS